MVAWGKVAIGSFTCVEESFEQRLDDLSDSCTLQGLIDLSALCEQRIDVVS
jgi:hypothetical protein